MDILNLKRSVELAYIIRDKKVLRGYELKYAINNGIREHLKKTFPHAWKKQNFFGEEICSS